MKKWECFSDAAEYVIAKVLLKMRSMSVSSDEKTIDSSSSNDLSNCRIQILVEDLKNPELLETTWQDKT